MKYSYLVLCFISIVVISCGPKEPELPPFEESDKVIAFNTLGLDTLGRTDHSTTWTSTNF
ncbi:MAG: hypothetical protein WBH03_03755 [Cyclobacteriaceae bacterium]